LGGFGNRVRQARAQSVVVVVAIIVGLTGCADSRHVVGPDDAAVERVPATRLIIDVTSLRGASSVLLASRTEDSCGVGGAGFQPADYGREYSCGVGRVALYTVMADSGPDAAVTANSLLAESGCTSTEPFNENPKVAELQSDAPGTHALEASYVCSEGGVRAVLAQTSDLRIRRLADELPSSPGGNYVSQDPPIDLNLIDELAQKKNTFILLLTASTPYFSVTVCNGVHLC
ncbi:MAG: hypothetical protein ACOH2T_29000, partial [Pseudomonas sp.]